MAIDFMLPFICCYVGGERRKEVEEGSLCPKDDTNSYVKNQITSPTLLISYSALQLTWLPTNVSELKEAIEAKKEEIESVGHDVGSASWAKQKRER